MVVIESADDSGLTALNTLGHMTLDFLVRQRLDVSGWPDDIAELARTGAGGRLIPTVDSRGQVRHLALMDCGEFDLLAGVASRRELNAESGTRNVAMNVLLALLSPDGEDLLPEGPYGVVFAAKRSRLWRNTAGAALLQETMREWHVRLVTDEGTIDFADSASTITGGVFSAQDAAESDRFVRESTIYRRIKHEDGRASSAHDKIPPFIRIDPVSGAYSYDLEVVAVLREMADRLIDGWSYRQVADAYAHRVPSYALRSEPDRETGRHSVRRTRAYRNELRRRAGRPQLPLRFLEDGITPNPEYRPEMMSDLELPEMAVMRLFEGPGASPKHPIPADAVNSDLDGIDPVRGYLACYRDGVYRKLHRDPDASGRTFSRWRWATFNLGPVDETGFVLTPAQCDALEARLASVQTTIVSGLPLVGLFEPQLPDVLPTRYGLLTAEHGRVSFSSARSSVAPFYVVQMRPYAGVPSPVSKLKTVTLAKLEATAMHRSLVDALSALPQQVLQRGTILPPPRPTPVEPAATEDAVAVRLVEAEAAFEAATLALAEPGLSAAQRQVLLTHADRCEQQLQAAQAAVTGGAGPSRPPADGVEVPAAGRDGGVPLGSLPEALAQLARGVPLPFALSGDVRRLLTRLLADATIRLDPAAGTVVWEATLTLPSPDGSTLRLPLSGVVPSVLSDDWLAGPLGRFFFSEMPFPLAWCQTEAGGDRDPSRVRMPVLEVLLSEHERHEGGLRLRGREEASLLARSHSGALVSAAFDLLRGRAAPDASALHRAVFDALFDGGSVGAVFSMRSKGEHAALRDVLAAASAVDGR